MLAPRTLRYLALALMAGTLCLVFGASADAQSPFWRSRPAPAPYSFSIEDDSGNPLPTFRRDGRTFLLGEPGLRYNIRVHNPTAARVEAVVSVDGRDAVSGEAGDYVNARGYVIPAYGSLLIEGFRRSYEEVAAFRFTSPENSYSARLGTPENVGVIGVAFFPERARAAAPMVRRPVPRPRLSPDYEYDRSRRGGADDQPAPSAPAKRRQEASAPASPSANSEGRGDGAARSRDAAKGAARGDLGSSARVNNLGTEFGETRESVVTQVAFERASQARPALISTLRYDDADGLSARGIDLSAFGYRRTASVDEPQAFPAARFAQPPP